MTEIEFVDRYGPAGPPGFISGCRGECEATGVIPVYLGEYDQRTNRGVEDEQDPHLRRLWMEIHESSDHESEVSQA